MTGSSQEVSKGIFLYTKRSRQIHVGQSNRNLWAWSRTRRSFPSYAKETRITLHVSFYINWRCFIFARSLYFLHPLSISMAGHPPGKSTAKKNVLVAVKYLLILLIFGQGPLACRRMGRCGFSSLSLARSPQSSERSLLALDRLCYRLKAHRRNKALPHVQVRRLTTHVVMIVHNEHRLTVHTIGRKPMPPGMKLRVPFQDRFGADTIDIYTKVVIDQPNGNGGEHASASNADET